MKKVFLVLLFCVFGTSFAQTQIHLIGSDVNGNLVHWLNGNITILPATGEYASVRAIAVSGSNVYVIGTDGDDAVYWLNGRRIVLPKTNRNSQARANAIAIDGNNIYIAGVDTESGVVYWHNERQINLPSRQDMRGEAYGITVIDSNIHITGSSGLEAAYWLNGILTMLPASGQLPGEGRQATAIAVSGSNVYITGKGEGGGASRTAGYWLNGRLTVLPKPANSPRAGGRSSTTANAIAISGSNVYIVGSDSWDGYNDNDGWWSSNSDAVYWLNGRRVVLPKLKDTTTAAATAIAVSRSNIYITGYEMDISGNFNVVYWLNGTRTAVPELRGISGIAIIE
ncbi:MAG: hypothetical protein FWD40_06970 [Treponema sp.]|nr:hypothetical protein [Treponema sp.]